MYFTLPSPVNINKTVYTEQNLKSDNDMYTFGNIRVLFHNTIYNDSLCITTLTSYIQKYIDCISIEYNNERKAYYIKIKKTTMKKLSKFENSSNYYYGMVNKIFREFITENPAIIMNAFSSYGEPNPSTLYAYLYNNMDKIILLCNIVCTGSNYLTIYL